LTASFFFLIALGFSKNLRLRTSASILSVSTCLPKRRSMLSKLSPEPNLTLAIIWGTLYLHTRTHVNMNANVAAIRPGRLQNAVLRSTVDNGSR
jgi:hypothetical protein